MSQNVTQLCRPTTHTTMRIELRFTDSTLTNNSVISITADFRKNICEDPFTEFCAAEFIKGEKPSSPLPKNVTRLCNVYNFLSVFHTPKKIASVFWGDFCHRYHARFLIFGFDGKIWGKLEAFLKGETARYPSFPLWWAVIPGFESQISEILYQNCFYLRWQVL